MKKIIIGVLIALVAFISFGLMQAAPLQNLQIVKSVTVNASKEKAFDMVRYLNNYPKWSPFLVEDPSQKYSVKGTDGTVGAQYHWDGNGGSDLGFQEIIKIDTFAFVGMKCDIQKPFVAKPTFDYSFKQVGNAIEITQDFKVQSDLVSAFFMWLSGAKKGMEDTNQKGLDLLKKAVEQG